MRSSTIIIMYLPTSYFWSRGLRILNVYVPILVTCVFCCPHLGRNEPWICSRILDRLDLIEIDLNLTIPPARSRPSYTNYQKTNKKLLHHCTPLPPDVILTLPACILRSRLDQEHHHRHPARGCSYPLQPLQLRRPTSLISIHSAPTVWIVRVRTKDNNSPKTTPYRLQTRTTSWCVSTSCSFMLDTRTRARLHELSIVYLLLSLHVHGDQPPWLLIDYSSLPPVRIVLVTSVAKTV